MSNEVEFINTKKEFTTPSSTLNYSTNNINPFLLSVGIGAFLFTANNTLKQTISMKNDIKLEMLDSYKKLTTPMYSESEDYSKILTNVVTKILSNTEDFSDINQYINDNFWDLI